MVRLSADTLGACAGRVAVPSYDRGSVVAGVVHLGVGGFHRAHQAVYHDRLLAQGATEWGICGVGVLPGDRRMRDALAAQDGLYTHVVKHPDGTLEARVIGSIVEYLLAPDDPEAVIEKLAAPTTRIVSLTITEGGYAVDDNTGAFRADDPAVAADLAGDGPPRTAFGLVAEALRRRRARDVAPFAVLSCDNLEDNGHVARAAFGGFAGLLDRDLGTWVDREVAFPNSVVDRITPATTDEDRAQLQAGFGIEDQVPVVSEPFTQWVLEGAGLPVRPRYEDAGVLVVDDAHPHELMKLRLLNAGHQVLAYFGRLLGHRFVHEAAEDPDLRAFLVGYLDDEAIPTLAGVGAAQIAAFRGPLVERFANHAVSDTLERLATDASDRIPKFLLPVVRDRLAQGGDVTRCATVVAGWTRFAAGVDEQGAPIVVRDRRADALTARARRRHEDPDAFLADRDLFGDLVEHERFVTPYRRALAALDAHGARATLAALG